MANLYLYVAGLHRNEQDFIPVLEQVESYPNQKCIVFPASSLSETFLNLDSYISADNPYFFKKFSAEILNEQISQVVSDCRQFSNLNLHIRVRTGKENGLEPIFVQSQKLSFLVHSLKYHKIIHKIVLVGHSQGGLVNLDCAIRCPNLIEKLISISTPYDKTIIGQKLLLAYSMSRLIRQQEHFTTLFTNNQKTDINQYEQRVKELSSYSIYLTIKKKWEKMKNRPILHVITGVSGLLEQGLIHSEKIEFDGLVSLKEQQAISHATFFNFAPPEETSLPLLNINKLIITSLLKGNLDQTMEDIAQTINQAIDDKELSNKTYADIYSIYNSVYSHDNLRYQEETIKIILL